MVVLTEALLVSAVLAEELLGAVAVLPVELPEPLVLVVEKGAVLPTRPHVLEKPRCSSSTCRPPSCWTPSCNPSSFCNCPSLRA